MVKFLDNGLVAKKLCSVASMKSVAAHKACISAGAVRKLSAAEVRLARMDDLRSLFEVEEG